MHIVGARGQRIELDLVTEASPVEAIADPTRAAGLTVAAAITMRAGRAFFDLGRHRGPVVPRPTRAEPPPVAFRERDSGLLRTIHREVVVRFAPDTSERSRRAILRERGFETRRVNPFVEDQVVAVERGRKLYGPDLVDAANAFVEDDEVLFATPNFVSQYRREAVPNPPRSQWHLNRSWWTAGRPRPSSLEADYRKHSGGGRRARRRRRRRPSQPQATDTQGRSLHSGGTSSSPTTTPTTPTRGRRSFASRSTRWLETTSTGRRARG